MILTELRKKEEVTAWWAKVFHSNRFQPIWDMLQEMHPLKFCDDKTRFSIEASAHRMGMLEGYELCLERLKLAAQYDAEKEPLPEASFEPIMQKEL